MKMNNEVKCPICGKTGISGELTVIDRRTGKKATGLGTLLFGIILVAIAVFMLVLIIILWNDRTVPVQQYIYLPIILLIGGIPIIYSHLREDRAKIVIYKCASCGKTITQDELEGTNLAKIPIKRAKARLADSTKKIIWVCSVLVVALVVVFLFGRPRTSERQSVTGQKMLVVLPFENLGLPEDEDLVNGITEAINTHLAGKERLCVIPHQSAMQYKDSNKTARQISQELGVDYLLYGSVLSVKSGSAENSVRLVLQLIRATDDMHIWAETYKRDLVELSRVQSNIAGKVASQLGVASH